ncbi:replication/maintenance protein RepL [Chromohalobacter sp. 48-RD10]|uniref:replication/maintenance protein RepL n=3 Tax=unclassified Chromohalobacter TaxID=2628571 RepID=UPI002468DDB5|nr:replication/maintenance protein RepL [Chromohalobacter sp. 48-RD10]
MSDTKTKLTQPQVRGSWVQTERKAHEKWASLISRKPRAAALLHLIIANMNSRGALIASQTTLAELSGTSVSTVKRSVKVLVDEQWVQTIRIGSERGGALAYVVNRRVAWADKRKNSQYALFDARVLVSERDNPQGLEGPDLTHIPSMSPADGQLPSGDGEAPPSQPSIDGLEPDLPHLRD